MIVMHQAIIWKYLCIEEHTFPWYNGIEFIFFTTDRKDLSTMKFFEQWDKLENLKAKVILKHSFFGRQMHNCDVVKVINDDRIGLVLKGQEIFVTKQDVVRAETDGAMYTISDGILTITLIVNKL